MISDPGWNLALCRTFGRVLPLFGKRQLADTVDAIHGMFAGALHDATAATAADDAKRLAGETLLLGTTQPPKSVLPCGHGS